MNTLSIVTNGLLSPSSGGSVIIVEASGDLKMGHSSFDGVVHSSSLKLALDGRSSDLNVKGSKTDLSFTGVKSGLSN